MSDIVQQVNRIQVVKSTRHFVNTLFLLKIFREETEWEDAVSLVAALQFCYRNSYTPGHKWPGEEHYWCRLPRERD